MQCQLQYCAIEDRGLWLLAAEGQTHAWWLTRRMSQVLFETMVACLQPQTTHPDAQAWQLNLQHEAAQGQFNHTRSAILTPDMPPTLVTEIRYGKNIEQNHVLILVTPSQQHTLTLSDTVLCGFLALFARQLSAFPWDLQLTWPPAVTSVSTSKWRH